MALPDLDWVLESESEPSAYERGYGDGVLAVLSKFEQELYVATKEDPQYAAYIEDSIKIIKNVLKPLVKD
jgi:predicted RNA methylase